jgi:hypothetical protein
MNGPGETVDWRAAFLALCAAVREHRDQRGDDRCWRDDRKLYASLPEGYT